MAVTWRHCTALLQAVTPEALFTKGVALYQRGNQTDMSLLPRKANLELKTSGPFLRFGAGAVESPGRWQGNSPNIFAIP
jgi:hypothetical protein